MKKLIFKEEIFEYLKDPNKDFFDLEDINKLVFYRTLHSLEKEKANTFLRLLFIKNIELGDLFKNGSINVDFLENLKLDINELNKENVNLVLQNKKFVDIHSSNKVSRETFELFLRTLKVQPISKEEVLNCLSQFSLDSNLTYKLIKLASKILKRDLIRDIRIARSYLRALLEEDINKALKFLDSVKDSSHSSIILELESYLNSVSEINEENIRLLEIISKEDRYYVLNFLNSDTQNLFASSHFLLDVISSLDIELSKLENTDISDKKVLEAINNCKRLIIDMTDFEWLIKSKNLLNLKKVRDSLDILKILTEKDAFGMINPSELLYRFEIASEFYREGLKFSHENTEIRFLKLLRLCEEKNIDLNKIPDFVFKEAYKVKALRKLIDQLVPRTALRIKRSQMKRI